MHEISSNSNNLPTNNKILNTNDIVLLADNLQGGSARLAECFMNDWIANLSSTDTNTRFLHVLCFTKLQIPNHPSIFKYIIKKNNILLFQFIKRGLFLRKFKTRTFILNLTNFPIPDIFLNDNHQQLTLIHNAYLVSYPKCIIPPPLKFVAVQFIKKFIFLLTIYLSRKSQFVVQTHWMRNVTNNFLSKFFIKRKINIVPYAAQSNMYTKPINHKTQLNGKELFWFYPAAFYPHKNHYFLIELGKRIKTSNINLKIFITISDSDKAACRFMKFVNDNELSDIILNKGWLSQEETYEYYKHARGLLFLSSFESLGLPLLEAYKLNKKIIAAKIESFIEMLGDYPYYIDLFNKDSVENCFNEMTREDEKEAKNIEYISIYQAYCQSFI